MADHTIDAAIQMAGTIQTAHINRHPDPEHERAPSTAMDSKRPVNFASSLPEDDVLSEIEDADEDEIPVSILRPTPRRPQMPPLPDMRFEQSYLASIKDCAGWQGVADITMRDQVLMPFVQGTVWALLVAGWRHWNGAASFKGRSIGSRIRRWWWGGMSKNFQWGTNMRNRR